MGNFEDQGEDYMKKKSIALISVFPLYTGTSRVVIDYYRALKDMGLTVNIYQFIAKGFSVKYPEATRYINGINLPPINITFPLNLLFILPRKLQQLKEDVVIITDPAALSLKPKFPNAIVIFYDIRDFTKYSKNFLKKTFFKYLLRYVKDHDNIITMSDYSKKMLNEEIGKELNVEVVEGCSSFSNDISILKERRMRIFNNNKINIFYLAADRPYKNIKLFLQIAKIFDTMKTNIQYNFKLLSRLNKTNKKLLKKLSLSNMEIIESTDDLRSLYEKVDLLLYPSLIEGFGLPLVEAMSFGIPIIYSNLPPMTEIVGTAGISLDPYSLEDWMNAIINISEPKSYYQMSLLSFERSKNFSYDIFKERLMKVLNNFEKR